MWRIWHRTRQGQSLLSESEKSIVDNKNVDLRKKIWPVLKHGILLPSGISIVSKNITF